MKISRRSKAAWVLVAAIGCAAGARGMGARPEASVELVRDGRARAAVVIPADAPAPCRFAAEELAAWVNKITGAELAVTNAAPPGLLPIRIGLAGTPAVRDTAAIRRAAAQLRDDGFAIVADDAGVDIISRKGRGTLYGAYHLLRRYGGLLWFHPGDDGEFCPTNADFRVASGIDVKNPAFAGRKIILNGAPGWVPDTYLWFVRNGIQVYSGFRKPHPQTDFIERLDPIYEEGGHDMTQLLVGYSGLAGIPDSAAWRSAYDALFRQHPEYYGLRDGRRVDSGNPAPGGKPVCQPCTSNPETLARMTAHGIERVSRFGDRENIRTLCNDDHTRWCQCAFCAQQDPSEEVQQRHVSTRWWHFVNHFADALLTPDRPGQRINSLVYQTYRFPPRGVRPDPRVSVTICPHQRCYLHPLADPSCAVNADMFRPMFESWHAIGMRATTFEYHTQMPGASRYLPLERAWIEDLRYYKTLDMLGYSLVTRAPYGNYGRKEFHFDDHMWLSLWQLHWLTAYFSWNLDADFDAVSDALNAKYYGPAWPAMKRYRAELEAALYEPRVHMGYGTPNVVLGKCGERAGFFDRIAGLLDEAERAAAGDALRIKRIARDRLYFKENWEAAHADFARTRQKEVAVSRREGVLAIDGRLDEDDWRRADVVTGFHVFAPDEGAGLQWAAPQTFVRVLFDEAAVYFGIEAMKAKSGQVRDLAEGDGIPAALQGSHIEIFLAPPQLGDRYYHFGFTRNGHTFQALTTSPSARDETVRIEPEIRLADAPDRWTAEVRAPIGLLVPQTGDGEVWKINVARNALSEGGEMQLSSWSGGVFHGAEFYRSLAFGRDGAIVRNGDLEDGIEPARKADPGRNWEYASERVPRHWHFNENNRGRADWRSGAAASGQAYLRISGTNAFVSQAMHLPDPEAARFDVSLKVRGAGEILARIRDARGGYHGQVQAAPAEPDAWRPLSGIVECPAEGPKTLALRITGTIDVDEIRVAVADEEAMPDASKH